MVLNYIEQLFILVLAITGSVSFSAFAILVGIGIAGASVRLKFSVIASQIKKFKSTIKKKYMIK